MMVEVRNQAGELLGHIEMDNPVPGDEYIFALRTPMAARGVQLVLPLRTYYHHDGSTQQAFNTGEVSLETLMRLPSFVPASA